MTHKLNETVKLEGDNYTIIAIIHDDGNTDAGISIHVGRSARDGHCELIATDNACDWLFGDCDDHVNNRDHFAALSYRVDIDAIRAIDGDLADYVAERQAEADEYEAEVNRETIGERFGNRHNPALKWIPGRPETLHIESALTPNNEGEETVRVFAGVGDFCEYLGECDEDTVMTDAEWQSVLVQLAQ